LLNFIYSTVNAGKSANLIMRAHSCKERDIEYRILVPEIAQARDGKSKVSSRIGFEQKATTIRPKDNPFSLIMQEVIFRKDVGSDSIQVVFVDEAQFLTRDQVLGLAQIVDKLEIPVFAYGLRTDFKGEPFEGSKYLLAWSDHIEEVATFSPGTTNKATFNMKIDQEGNQISSGESISPGFGFMPVSRKEFDLS
jgi:thymidine kinase